ncbi:unnamed protein product [Amaranthus hypochondriacus]
MVLMQTLLTFSPSPITPLISHPIRQSFVASSPSLSHHSARPLLASVARRHLSICPPCFVTYSGADKMNGVLEMELNVRDYELDQYGVVNNAVYSSYCQLANHELLRSIGLDDDAVDNISGALALSKLSLAFVAPLRSGDKFVVKSTISDLSAARLFFDHFIYKLPNQQPILEAKAVIVLLDKKYRPVRIPAEVKAKSAQFMNQQNSTIHSTTLLASVQCTGMKPNQCKSLTTKHHD